MDIQWDEDNTEIGWDEFQELCAKHNELHRYLQGVARKARASLEEQLSLYSRAVGDTNDAAPTKVVVTRPAKMLDRPKATRGGKSAPRLLKFRLPEVAGKDWSGEEWKGMGRMPQAFSDFSKSAEGKAFRKQHGIKESMRSFPASKEFIAAWDHMPEAEQARKGPLYKWTK